MDTVQKFKNFNLGKEIDLAGSFAYNALSILNNAHDIYKNDQIFLFLYNAAVSIERMQKCVLFIHGEYCDEEINNFGLESKIHSHEKLQNKINSHTGKKLSEDQNAFLLLLSNFYASGRYSNFSVGNEYNYKLALENFVKKYYENSMVETHYFSKDTYITADAKERIGRTFGKLLTYYYALIKDKARELNLFTYELRSGSPAEKVFLNPYPKKSLQAVNQSERTALAEIIVYLLATQDHTGYLNFLRQIKPLQFDPYMVQEYLADIINREIPQSLVDEVETIYEEMSHKDLSDRAEQISIIGERNVYFPEDDEDE